MLVYHVARGRHFQNTEIFNIEIGEGENVGIEKVKIFGEKSKFMFYIYR